MWWYCSEEWVAAIRFVAAQLSPGAAAGSAAAMATVLDTNDDIAQLGTSYKDPRRIVSKILPTRTYLLFSPAHRRNCCWALFNSCGKNGSARRYPPGLQHWSQHEALCIAPDHRLSRGRLSRKQWQVTELLHLAVFKSAFKNWPWLERTHKNALFVTKWMKPRPASLVECGCNDVVIERSSMI